MVRQLLVAFGLVIIASSVCAQDDDTTDLDDIPHITMVGTARIEVPPDLATITLGVRTEKPSAAAAAAANADKARGIIDAAKAQGIATRDIATQSVTLIQTFDEIRDKKGNVSRKPRGYAADNTISVKVRDLEKAGEIAESLITKGANRFDGIGFTIEHPEPIVSKLVASAVADARAQAQSAADAAGLRLTRVLLIERPESGTGVQRPQMYDRMQRAPAPTTEMPIEAGTSTLTTSISVTWAIAPR